MTLNVKPFRVLKRVRWVKENDRAALELAKRNARARNKVQARNWRSHYLADSSASATMAVRLNRGVSRAKQTVVRIVRFIHKRPRATRFVSVRLLARSNRPRRCSACACVRACVRACMRACMLAFDGCAPHGRCVGVDRAPRTRDGRVGACRCAYVPKTGVCTSGVSRSTWVVRRRRDRTQRPAPPPEKPRRLPTQITAQPGLAHFASAARTDTTDALTVTSVCAQRGRREVKGGGGGGGGRLEYLSI